MGAEFSELASDGLAASIIFGPKMIDHLWLAEFTSRLRADPGWLASCERAVEARYARCLSDADGFSRIGWALAQTGLPEDASKYFERDRTAGRMRRWQFVRYVEVLVRLGQEAAAQELVSEYYSSHPEAYDGWAAIGFAYLARGDLTTARSFVRRDQAEGRLSPLGSVQLAQIEARLGSWDVAERLISEAYASSPNLRDARVSLCHTAGAGRDRSFRHALYAADARDGRLSAARAIELARAMGESGRLSDAVEILSKADGRNLPNLQGSGHENRSIQPRNSAAKAIKDVAGAWQAHVVIAHWNAPIALARTVATIQERRDPAVTFFLVDQTSRPAQRLLARLFVRQLTAKSMVIVRENKNREAGAYWHYIQNAARLPEVVLFTQDELHQRGMCPKGVPPERNDAAYPFYRDFYGRGGISLFECRQWIVAHPLDQIGFGGRRCRLRTSIDPRFNTPHWVARWTSMELEWYDFFSGACFCVGPELINAYRQHGTPTTADLEDPHFAWMWERMWGTLPVAVGGRLVHYSTNETNRIEEYSPDSQRVPALCGRSVSRTLTGPIVVCGRQST